MEQWRLRQIHLDFHTSPKIKDVGVDFNAEDFSRTLVEAGVDWVTLFAKCHHGMCYYPTKVGPMHPGLKFDLLGSQVEACRKKGIVTPAYISVHVDNYMGEKHPEWVGRLADGKLWGPAAFEAGWYNLCLNHKEYIDYVEAMTEEVLKNYDVDGIFYDMCYYPPYPGCFCQTCLDRMEKAGIDRSDNESHQRQELEITREYTTRLTAAIRRIKPKASIFYNGRVGYNLRRELDILTHLEIEALPTTPMWGYHYFPFWARFCRTFGLPTQGMTGRFHKSWADFGGLKTADQLRYEAGTILATASAMSIGDQLHPRGVLDKGAYQVIGEVFKEVAEKEPWCLNAKPVAEIAVLCLPAKSGEALPEKNEAAEAAGRMLLELKHQFNVETPEGNLNQYRLLVLPDQGVIDDALAGKLSGFLKKGGSLILSHQAGFNPETGCFNLPEMKVSYEAANQNKPCFLRLSGELAEGLPETDFVFYGDSSLVKPEKGTKDLGKIVFSYFNRDYNHFTSHFHSPADKVTEYPAAVQAGKIIYFAPEIFTGYLKHGYLVYKKIVANALRILLPDPLLKAVAPAAMEISLTRQEKPERTMVHLVNYQPQRRHAEVEYIEYLWPVREIKISVRMKKKPVRIYLAPEKESLPFVFNAGYADFVVPEVTSHQIICLEF